MSRSAESTCCRRSPGSSRVVGARRARAPRCHRLQPQRQPDRGPRQARHGRGAAPPRRPAPGDRSRHSVAAGAALDLPVVLKPRFGAGAATSPAATRSTTWSGPRPGARAGLVQPHRRSAAAARAAARIRPARDGRGQSRGGSRPRDGRGGGVADERGARSDACHGGAAAHACELALAAAAAVDGDLVGVDLLPTEHGAWTVLEVNGAADFNDAYSVGPGIFAAVRSGLLRRHGGASAHANPRGRGAAASAPPRVRRPCAPEGKGEWSALPTRCSA